MRRFFALSLTVLSALALAGACDGYDVVLRVEKPAVVLAGAEFELVGDVLTFSGGACIAAPGGSLKAKTIVYRRDSGKLRAERVEGVVSGWRVAAPLLSSEGDELVLRRPLFRRGDSRVRAETARLLGEKVVLSALEAVTPRYRFRAARGELLGDAFRVSGLWATPCKCGEALAVKAESAEFYFDEGRLVLRRNDLRFFGISASRPDQLLLELNKPLNINFPLRFSYAAGWTLGVENLPLPLAGEAFGRWRNHLTFLLQGLGGGLTTGKTTTLRLALDSEVDGGRLHFGFRPRWRWENGAWRNWLEPDVSLRQDPLFFSLGWSRSAQHSTASFVIAPRFSLLSGYLALEPFARLAAESYRSGASVGLGGELRAPRLERGPFALSFSTPWVGALYPEAPPYAWAGGRLQAAWGGWAELKLQKYWAFNSPRYAYEARSAREAASLKIGREWWARLSFARDARYSSSSREVYRYDSSYRLDLVAKDPRGRLAFSWLRRRQSDPTGAWLADADTWRLAGDYHDNAAIFEWRRGWSASEGETRNELWFSYRPPLPDCAGGWALQPSLGYDILHGGVSRAGLELQINDCCFTWSLAYQGVLIPQTAGEAAGGRVTFDVKIR